MSPSSRCPATYFGSRRSPARNVRSAPARSLRSLRQSARLKKLPAQVGSFSMPSRYTASAPRMLPLASRESPSSWYSDPSSGLSAMRPRSSTSSSVGSSLASSACGSASCPGRYFVTAASATSPRLRGSVRAKSGLGAGSSSVSVSSGFVPPSPPGPDSTATSGRSGSSAAPVGVPSSAASTSSSHGGRPSAVDQNLTKDATRPRSAEGITPATPLSCAAASSATFCSTVRHPPGARRSSSGAAAWVTQVAGGGSEAPGRSVGKTHHAQ